MPGMQVATQPPDPVIWTRSAELDKAIYELRERVHELVQHIGPVMLPLEMPGSNGQSVPKSPECAIAGTLGELAENVRDLSRFVQAANRNVQL